MANKLWACPLEVERGSNQKMPGSWLGAYVTFYVGAVSHEEALTKAVKALRHMGMIFVDVPGGKVTQLDPHKWWDGYVLAKFPQHTAQFPSQEQIVNVVNEGLVFHGPFAGWDRE